MAGYGNASNNDFDPIEWDMLLEKGDYGNEAPDDKELALCIVIQRSRVDIGRSLSSTRNVSDRGGLSRFASL